MSNIEMPSMHEAPFAEGDPVWLSNDWHMGSIRKGKIEKDRTGALCARCVGGFGRRLSDEHVHADSSRALVYAEKCRLEGVLDCLSCGDAAMAVRLEGLIFTVVE